jgi:hypothetical protein
MNWDAASHKAWLTPLDLKGKTSVKSSAQAQEARHETQEQEHKLKVVRI